MLTFSSMKTKIATLSGGCLLMSALVLVGWSLVGGRQTGDFVQQKTETLLDKNAENYLGAIANEQAGNIRLEFGTALGCGEWFRFDLLVVGWPEFQLTARNTPHRTQQGPGDFAETGADTERYLHGMGAKRPRRVGR
jgi:hypothetical protein